MDKIEDGKPTKCQHDIVKCLCCGEEGTPHRLLATRTRKRAKISEMPEENRQAAIEQRRAAGKKGGWPKGKPRKPKAVVDPDKIP